MAYEKTEWQNGVTPLSADNMNHIEEGIYQLNQSLYNVGNNVVELGVFIGGNATLDIEDFKHFRFIATQSEFWGTWSIGFFSPAALLGTGKLYGFNFVTNEKNVAGGTLKFNSNTNATIECVATTYLYGIR